MRGEEIAVTLALGLPIVVLIAAVLGRSMRNRHQLEITRLQVLQEALRHAQLDDATRTELTRALADDWRRRGTPRERFGRWLRAGHVLLLGAGWLLLIGGIGFWIAGEAMNMSRWSIEPAVVSTVTGLALVTLPLALRELLGRRGPAAPAAQR